jgi:hypothetical protein
MGVPLDKYGFAVASTDTGMLNKIPVAPLSDSIL